MLRSALARRSAILTLLLVISAARLFAQGADSLGIKDLLDLNNVGIQDLTADGKWLAVTIATRRDGLGTDYFRDNDPTYLRAAMSRLMIVDTKTGAQRAVFPTKKAVRAASWSPDGTRLAMFLIENDALQLNVWDRVTSKLTTLKLPPNVAGQYIAENSELRWTADGKQLVFSLRTDAWKKAATARFVEITKGPITVLNGSDDFLEWDELGRRAQQRSIASWDIAAGTVKTLVPEQRLSSWSMAEDGSVVVTNEDLQTKTNYGGGGGGGGRANKIVAHSASGTRTLFATSQGVQISWAEDGRHYTVSCDGRVFLTSLDDSTRKQILGQPAPNGATNCSGTGLTGITVSGGRGGRGGRGGGGAPAPADSGRGGNRAAANERFAVSRWSANGQEILATNPQGIWIVKLADGTKEMAVALPDSSNTSAPRPTVTQWSHDGRYLYLSVASRTEWNRAILRYDRQTKATDTLVRGAKYFNGLRVSDDGTTSVLTIADGNHIADVYVGDGALGGLRRIIESNPQLATKPVAKTELIRYHNADGKSEYGVLFYPANYQKGTKYPTVFIIYEDFFDDTWDVVANLLSAHGYAVMKPSVDFDIGFPGEAWTKGVTAAANKLIEMGIADSSRLGVHGTSYGGFATNFLITQTKRFAAAINMSGKVDMISFYTDSPRLGARNINAAEASQDRIGATLWEQPQKYIANSAIFFADRITTPLLLLTGGQDHNVPELNEREMYYALRRLGKTVTWVSYTNSGHGTPGTTESDFV
ncbi:MAG TPA: prolyl oligopeptidase family serine peptidase, partial [Gemmatimonadaceae bacterium]|nr:prolyl oligopeptidase family serine peptidase [Gemmatimonadaceae bacterium]